MSSTSGRRRPRLLAEPDPRATRGRLLIAVLREHVADGTWPVGSRIPPEPDLVELLGAGRNAVREAVQSLVHAGLLVKRQGSGTYVVARDELGSTMARHVEHATAPDAWGVRRALEVEAAAGAARNRTSRDLASLQLLAATCDRAQRSDDAAETLLSDLALLRGVVVASRNALLRSLYEALADATDVTVRHGAAQASGATDAHARLVDAVTVQDAAGAAGWVARLHDRYTLLHGA